jgi:hypothetical protein
LELPRCALAAAALRNTVVSRRSRVVSFASTHGTINGIGIFNAPFAGHGDDALPVGEGGQPKNERYYGFMGSPIPGRILILPGSSPATS